MGCFELGNCCEYQGRFDGEPLARAIPGARRAESSDKREGFYTEEARQRVDKYRTNWHKSVVLGSAR